MARRTCGYCGDTGHNRSTCPTHKASIDKLRESRPRKLARRFLRPRAAITQGKAEDRSREPPLLVLLWQWSQPSHLFHVERA